MIKHCSLFLSAIVAVFSFAACTSTSEKQVKVDYSPIKEIAHPTYVCYRTPNPINIDGNLSEWKDIPAVSDFVDIVGETEPAPKYKTITKMAYDESGLYIAAVMEEPHIWSYMTKHDSDIYQENCFEVFINPSGSTHNYMEYQINARGADWDLFLTCPYRDNPTALSDWEFLGKRSAVSIDGSINNPSKEDKSWSIELFFPWKSINQAGASYRGVPKAGDQIRMNFARVAWDTKIVDGNYVKDTQKSEQESVNYWVWAPAGAINMHAPELWGYVQFSDKIAGQGTDKFVEKPCEAIKWMLRKLYYRQKEYKKQTGKYTDHAEELCASDFCSPEQLSNITIEKTSSFFEITFSTKDGNTWRIDDKGRVWSAPL